MKLIVGLGNPGEEYVNTRHNIGFMYLDYVFGDNFKLNKKFNAFEYITDICGERIIVIKPLSYMNLSGDVVIRYINYYKMNIDDIIIVQDDLDMEIGKYKLLFNHGDGGHNGIKNIIDMLGSKKFLRLKIGISKVMDQDIKNYVLGKFNSNELVTIKNVFINLDSFIDDFINLDSCRLMEKYNRRS